MGKLIMSKTEHVLLEIVWPHLLDDSSSLYDPKATEMGPADPLRSPHSLSYDQNITPYILFYCYKIVFKRVCGHLTTYQGILFMRSVYDPNA